MPTVASVAAMIERLGEPVDLLRVLDDGTAQQASVKAFVRGYRPEELGGAGAGGTGIVQGDRVLRIAPGSLAAAGWTDAPRKPDQVSVSDRTATVQSCETIRLGGTPCEYVVQVRGG